MYRFILSARHCVADTAAPMRRVETKSVDSVLTSPSRKDDAEARALLTELQDALHQYIERLRSRLPNYPIIVERRARNEIPAKAR